MQNRVFNECRFQQKYGNRKSAMVSNMDTPESSKFQVILKTCKDFNMQRFESFWDSHIFGSVN